MIFPSSSISESFQQGYVMRLLHFALICPPQLKRPIKSLLGNMTHVVPQPLYYSNKQLLFVTSKPPHPSSPPQETMAWARIASQKDQIELWSNLLSREIWGLSDFFSDGPQVPKGKLNHRPNYNVPAVEFLQTCTCNSYAWPARPRHPCSRIFLLLCRVTSFAFFIIF